MHKKERRKLKYQARSRAMVRQALIAKRKHRNAVIAWRQRSAVSAALGQESITINTEGEN